MLCQPYHCKSDEGRQQQDRRQAQRRFLVTPQRALDLIRLQLEPRDEEDANDKKRAKLSATSLSPCSPHL